MEKILFVRSNNTSPRVEKEANSLAKAKYDVNLFLWNRKSNTSKYKFENGYTIYEYGHKAPFGKYIIFYWVFWWYAIFRYLINTNNFNIVHVCGLESYPPVIFVKFIKRCIIIYDIFDFLGESLPIGTPRFIEKFVGDLERYLLKFADAVIIVDESRKIQIKDTKIPKLEIIMNCVSDDYNFSEYKANNEFTIFYGGLLSKTRGLNQLVHAIKNIKDLQLIVAGNGEDEEEFENTFNLYSNIKFLGQISHDEAIKLTYQSNVVFGFYNPEVPINRLASPNKLFEAMMCRTPIIVNEETSMAEIVRKENCGIVIPYNDELALKKSILELKINPEMCKKMGENGRKAFEREYNWDIMEERLLNLYNYCIDQKAIDRTCSNVR